MVLAVAALLFQFSSASLALPAAIPAHAAAAATFDTPESANLTPDLSSVHFSKNSTTANSTPTAEAGSSEAGAAGSLKPAPIESAQNLQSLSSIRIPEFNAAKENHIVQAERPSRRSWLALSLVQHGAATFDAYTTRQSIERGNVELDPTMRPFAHSPALYAAIQVGPVILDLLARKMERSPNNFVRRIWWLPQSVSTASFIYSGAHNMRVGNNP